MKKALRIIIPIVLSVVIIACSMWYLFVYDREFTRDMLLTFARFNESQGNHHVATWFYNTAYFQSGNSDDVAIELAQQYVSSGNYTKAEYTLSNAISDGGGVNLYIALSKLYVDQDKLLDATTMLASVTNPDVKAQLDSMRPSTPVVSPAPGFYSQYISVSLETSEGITYISTDGEYPTTATTPYSEPITLGDGENTIQAITVSENGLVSPLAIYGYTIGGVVKEMVFSDAAVEASVRSALNVNTDKKLYTNDLWTIKSFSVPSGAKDYSDLAYMTFLESLIIEKGSGANLNAISSLANLTEISLTDTPISQEQLEIIASLPLIKKITLTNCNISSISPLSKATGLIYLDLNNNTIRNIDALSTLSNIQELNLSHNAIADLSALSSLTAMKSLDVSHNSIASLAPVSTLTGLTKISAGVNHITTLGKIGSLTNLTYLSLENNQLTNISDIASCALLTDLNISSNKLTNISELGKLKELMYFDFSYNQVTELPKFSKSCALVTINGANNLISSLSQLGGLKNLNNVNMDYNAKISSVKSLADCPVLIEVNVYGTKVTDVSSLTKQSVIVNYKPI